MRRLTSLMLLLLCAVTTWAQAPKLEAYNITSSWSGNHNGNTIYNAVDGNKNSIFWSNSSQSVGAYVALEFEKEAAIGYVNLYFTSGDQPTGNVAIKISSNGNDWEQVAQFSSTDLVNNFYGCKITDKTAKHVKLEILSVNGTNWFQLAEFEAYSPIQLSTDEEPIHYLIASYNRGGVLTNDNNTLKHIAISEGSYWYFTKANDNGGVYIINKIKDGENKLYLNGTKVSTDPYIWYLLPNGVNAKGLSISSTATLTDNSCLDASQDDTSIGTWKPASDDWAGTTWAFIKREQDVEDKYNPQHHLAKSSSTRKISAVSISSTKYEGNSSSIENDSYVTEHGLVYHDLTDTDTFRVVAGENVKAVLTRGSGDWTHAYAYIDIAGDGFTASVAEDGTPEGDLVAYSYYNGKNNAKQTITTTGNAHNTLDMPSFTAPKTPGTYRLRFKHDWDNIEPNGTNTSFYDHGTGGIIDVTLEVVETSLYDVTYEFYYNGEKKTEQTETVPAGGSYPDIDMTLLPYGTTATKPEGTVDSNITKQINVTDNLPFEYADSYENITKWYYVKNHSNNPKYIYHEDGQEYIPLNVASRPQANRDNYSWGFVGNPFDGFKIVNLAAGSEKILSSSTTMSGTTGGGTYPIMTAIPVPEGNNEYWMPTQGSVENGFFLAQKGYSFNRMNNRDGKLAYWTDDAGPGSTFMVEERPALEAEFAELLDVAEDKLTTVSTFAGEIYGYYPQDVVTAFTNAVNAAKAVETVQESDIITLQTAIDAIYSNVPAVGSLIAFKSASASSYCKNQYVQTVPVIKLYAGGGYEAKRSHEHLVYDTNSPTTTPAAVFEVCAGNSSYNFKLKNVHTQEYVKSFVKNERHMGTEAEAVTITLAPLGEEQIAVYGANDGSPMHAQEAHKVIVTWTAELNNSSAWYIEDVTAPIHTLTVGDAGWSTLVLGFNATIPTNEGFKAYTINEVTAENVQLVPATGVLAANTPIIVNAPAGNYPFEYTTAEATVNTSELSGTLYDSNITEEAYILAKVGDVVGLYKAQKDVSTDTSNDSTEETTYEAFKNNANKVYLLASKVPAGEAAASNGLRFDFSDGTTTEIEKVEMRNEKEEIFDLQGRRINEITCPGIYIVNGVKKVVKQ